MYQPNSLLGPKPTTLPPHNYNSRIALVPYVPTTQVEKANNVFPPNNPYHKLPIKRLTPAKRQLKIKKGQCYNCDKAWHKGHKCKGQMSLLLLEGILPEGCEELVTIDLIGEP